MLPSRTAPDRKLLLFSALFLVSGAAGLIYEIIWERLLQLYFGVTLVSITLIVAAYMAGTGLGSLLGGRLAPRLQRPLAVYGWIEILVGVFGAVSPGAITEIGRRTAGSSYPYVFILSFGLLLIPTFLMGATLPILSQSFVNRLDRAGGVIGLLYGINTLGAAAGAILAGYVLVGAIGFDGAAQAACLLNLIAGGLAVLFGSRGHGAMTPTTRVNRSRGRPAAAWAYRAILAAAFLVGFIHLGFEMLWFRVLGVINKMTAYSFPTILAVFLLGLAIGATVWGREADRSTDPVRLFWTIELWVGLCALGSFLLMWLALQMELFQPAIQDAFGANQQPAPAFLNIAGTYAFSRRALLASLAAYLLPIVVMVLPAGIAMGAGLPILDRIAISSPAVSGRRVGDIHLANILGSVSGTLAASFLFLPLVGSEITFKLLAGLCAAFLAADAVKRRKAAANGAALLLCGGLVALIVLLPGRGVFFREYFERGTGQDVVIKESGDAVLALSLDANSPRGLWIGGVQNSYFPTNGQYERSLLACAAAAHPERVLIIGLGGGNTAHFASTLPDLQQLVVIELLPELGPFLAEHVSTTARLLQDERLVYVVDDGRRYLYAHPEDSFDLIFIDPLYSFTIGHNNLYSRDAMELYLRHLKPGGIFCPWVNERSILPGTAAMTFPSADFFGDFLVAGTGPIHYDIAYMEAAVDAFEAASGGDHTNAMLSSLAPSEVLLRYRADEDTIRKYFVDAPYLTDLTPLLEYYLFRRPLEQISRTAGYDDLVPRLSECVIGCIP